MSDVWVELGARRYPVVIEAGLLAGSAARLAPLARGRAMVIVSDAQVAPHLAVLRDTLAAAGVRSESIVLPSGESTKSWAMLEEL